MADVRTGYGEKEYGKAEYEKTEYRQAACSAAEQALAGLRPFETASRRLYEKNPEAYGHVVWNWEQFREDYRNSSPEGEDPGEAPPFFMGSQLTEQDCFPDEREEVSLILHDRYAPPFYHSLKFIKIVYALRGGFRFYVRGRDEDLGARMEEGDFVVIPPEVNQAVFTADENAVTVNIIIKRSTFGEAFYSLLAENDSISDFFWQMLYSKGGGRALLVRCGADETLRALVLRMCGEKLFSGTESSAGSIAGSNAGKNLMMKGYILVMFGRALERHQQVMESIGNISAAEAALPMIVRYIRENYTTVTLSGMAKRFGRSEGYLSRYIRLETGKTFRCLLKEFRMKRAVEMLENSSCSVEEVAAAVGYADISCFYRNFRETYNMTPMQYRSIRSRISL